MYKKAVFLFLILCMNCNTSKDIDVQGHRGCRGLMPENSLPAFKKAIALGVHTLELDVAISKDQKVIVSHEPFISRTYCLHADGKEIPMSEDKKHNIYQLTYQEIQAFDCGSKPHDRFPDQEKLKTFKPSLEAVFITSDALNDSIKYNIELKAKPAYDGVYTPKPKEFVALVLETIQTYQVFNRCNLQSFDLRILEEIKKQAPTMDVAILIDEDENISQKLKQLSFKPEIISPYFKLLNQKNTKTYQKEGFKVIPWTVNSIAEMNEMIQYQVDGIITDFPDVLLRVLQGVK